MSWGRRGVAVACALSALLGVGTASAGAPPDQGSGTRQTITVEDGGRLRDALLYVAPRVPALTPVPLVLVLHGLANDPQTVDAVAGMDAVADRQDVAVLYPHGLGGSWDAGACCGSSARQHVDDVSFLVHLVRLAAAVRPIDLTRVYVAGFSNGAMMALKAACTRPDVFAAAASVSGTLEAPCTGAGHPSALFLHGLADRTVPWGGEQHSTFLHTTLRAVPVSALLLARRAGCHVRRTTSTGRVTDISYAGCAPGADVQVRAYAGLGHAWPTQERQGIDGGRIVWSFLSRHRLVR